MSRLHRSMLVLALLSMLPCAACSGPTARSGGGAGSAMTRNVGPRAAGAAGGAADDAHSAPLPLGQQLIRAAELTVAVRSASQINDRADAAGSIAERAGGEIDSDDRSAGRHAVATVQLRVPPTRLQQVLRALAALGTERSRSSSTEDVTERVADVSSRVISAQDSLARLRTLYARASRVADVIAIESEISDREADLESLQAQQRALGRQTALATVTVHLVVAAPSRHSTPGRAGGFVGGVQRGWHAFTAVLSGFAAALGALLPFLALALVLAGLARALGLRLPRVMHRRPTPPAG